MRLAICLSILLFASAASAQAPISNSVNILSQVDRVKGTFTSVSYDVPADAKGELVIRLNMPTADYEDGRNSVRITIYALLNGAWVLGPSGLWESNGGTVIGKDGTVNPPVTESVKVFEPLGDWDLRGQAIRVEIEVFRVMKLGATAMLIDR